MQPRLNSKLQQRYGRVQNNQNKEEEQTQNIENNSQSHETNQNYHKAPKSYENFIGDEKTSASARYVIPSSYRILKKNSDYKKTGVPLTLTFRPLADIPEGEEEIPAIDYSNFPMLRCERCGAFLNPNFRFEGSEFHCNICQMKNQFTGERGNPQEPWDQTNGVYDLIVPKEFHVRPLAQPNILFCLELTKNSVESGLYDTFVEYIQSNIDSIHYEAKIGIVVYNTNVKFISIPDSLEEENVKLITCADFDDSFCALSTGELFLSLTKEREKINLLLKKISEMKEVLENESSYSSAVGNTTPVIKVINDAMKKTGGKALLFCTDFPIGGIGALQRTKLDDGKKEGSFKLKNEFYEKMGRTLNSNRIGLDVFLFKGKDLDISTFSRLSQLSGGSFFYYRDYEEYLVLTRYTGFEVAARLRASSGIDIGDYYTNAGVEHGIDFTIGCVHADSQIMVTLNPGNLSVSQGHFQFVCLFTDFFGVRKLRVINISLDIVDNRSYHYASLNSEGLFYTLMRFSIDYFRERNRSQLRVIAVENLRDILKSFKEYSDQDNSLEITVPKSIDVILILIHSLIRNPILNTKIPHPCDVVAYNYLFLTGRDLPTVMNHIYPKIYPLHGIDLDPESYSPGVTTDNGTVVLPTTIPATADAVTNEGIYLYDNGEVFYLYVGDNCNSELLYEVFGVESLEELYELYYLPYFEEEQFLYNQRVNRVIEEVRRLKNGKYPQVVMIIEGDANSEILDDLNVEDPYKLYKISAWNFMKKINDMI